MCSRCGETKAAVFPISEWGMLWWVAHWRTRKYLELMQLLYLLDTGQNVIAVTKIYLRASELTIGKQPPEWRWHKTLRLGASCFTWKKLPLALRFDTTTSVFLVSNMPISPIQVHREICVLLLPSFLASPLFPFFLTLLVTWEIWAIGIFFHQATYWSLHHQTSLKFMDRTTKKGVLCCTVLGSLP